MNSQLEILNRLFDGIKFKDAVYTEKTNTCVINFLHNPQAFTPKQENKEVILNKVKEIVGDFVKFDLNFIACPLDKRVLANHAYTTIVNDYPALSKNFTYDDVSVDINGLNVTITLKLNPTAYAYATDNNREELIANKFKDSFLADFSVKFEKHGDEVVSNIIESNMEFMQSIKEAEEKTVYKLTNIEDIIGKTDFSLASDFSKIKSPVENVVICGEISNLQKRTYKRQHKHNGETTEVEHAFFSFALRCEGALMYCSLFPRQADENKFGILDVGMKVCCHGSFKTFNGKLSFTAYTIARCNYSKEEIKSKAKRVNEEYHTVFPQDYVDYHQSGLFDDDEKSFEGNYVVFDLETTGLEASKDEIIEIGACKIENGKIVSVFSTFVKPSKNIPSEIVKLTGITDAMVKDAPTINYVLPDFYKYCYGSTLVGHNVNFDLGFIYNVAKKFSYDFDNPKMDTMEMARSKLPGLRNYKLHTIVERLGVILENAHRAVNDATATAKVFIKLM